MRVFDGVEEFRAAAGQVLGSSDWVLIDQARIDAFANATNDHQWIHVDRERARSGPFGETIAHGLLTLSLIPSMNGEIYRVDGTRLAVNYGYNRIRYPAPVAAGSRVRGTTALVSVEDVPGGVQAVVSTTVEMQGASKPACVAEGVVRLMV